MKKKQYSLIIIVLVMIALGCVVNVFVIAKNYYKDQGLAHKQNVTLAVDEDLLKFTTKSMEVGGSDLILYTGTERICEVMASSQDKDAVTLNNCKITAKKQGTVRIRAYSPFYNQEDYYEITVADPNNIGDNSEGNNGSGQIITDGKIDTDKFQDVIVWNMTVGDAAKQIGGATATTKCELVEGVLGVIEMGGLNYCTITPKKAGTIIVKYFNRWGDDPIREYYKIVVTEPNLGTNDNPTELDPNYKYGKIKKCDLGNVAAGIQEYNGNTFCVTPDKNYVPNPETTNFTCDNSLFDYEVFVVSFKINNTLYKGYGCRRPNNSADGENNIPNISDCKSLLGDPENSKMPAFYITKAFDIIKYVAIILLIVMSIFDFVGATGASNEDALKKATNKTIMRLVLCVIIFLLPTLISFILKYLNNRAIDLCGL